MTSKRKICVLDVKTAMREWGFPVQYDLKNLAFRNLSFKSNFHIFGGKKFQSMGERKLAIVSELKTSRSKATVGGQISLTLCWVEPQMMLVAAQKNEDKAEEVSLERCINLTRTLIYLLVKLDCIS